MLHYRVFSTLLGKYIHTCHCKLIMSAQITGYMKSCEGSLNFKYFSIHQLIISNYRVYSKILCTLEPNLQGKQHVHLTQPTFSNSNANANNIRAINVLDLYIPSTYPFTITFAEIN